MIGCTRCSIPSIRLPESGTLCIALPGAHKLRSVSDHLKRAGFPLTEPAAGVLAIPLTSEILRRLAECLGGVMSQVELRDSRSVIIDEGATLGLADLAAMQPLSTLIAKVRGEWFTTLLREGRLTSHFQPIVHASEPTSVFAHECLLRGLEPDGTLIAPGRLYEAARESDLLFPLDREARLTAIRSAVKHGLNDGGRRLFINFNPTSVYDPASCLRTTVSAIADTGLKCEQIVFEVVESDQIEDIAHLTKITDFYRNAGFKVALDDLGSGYGSLNLLCGLKPDFVKLDMQLVRGVDQDPYKAQIVGKLLEMAQKVGVSTVAEGIETEGEWTWCREQGVDYVQGFLFARPASPPPVPRQPARRAESQRAFVGVE